MRKPASLFLAVLAAWGCQALIVEPDDRAPGVSVQFQIEGVVDSVHQAILESIVGARVELTRGTTVADTVVPVSVRSDVARARLVLSPPEGEGPLSLRVELLAEQGPLFEGAAIVPRGTLEAAATVHLNAIPYVIRPRTSGRTFDALGERVGLDADVLLLSVDVWPPFIPSFTSEDPAVVIVQGGDTVVAVGNGRTRIEVSFEDLTAYIQFVVRQSPTLLSGVGPADTTISVGDTVRLRAFGEDANGYPLLPGADVSWAVTMGSAVTVDSAGLVQATAPGSALVTVTGASSSRAATVTVIP